MKKIFFYISIGYSIAFMIYAGIEVLYNYKSSPSALFFILMPTLLIGYAYHDSSVSLKVKRLIFFSNGFIFSAITIMVGFVLIFGDSSIDSFGLEAIELFALLYLTIYLLILVSIILVFTSFFLTRDSYPVNCNKLFLGAFIILAVSLTVFPKIGFDIFVIDILVTYSLIIIQGINIYILFNKK